MCSTACRHLPQPTCSTNLLHPKGTIKVKYIDVQMQKSYSDCGVVATAFMTALANGPGAAFSSKK